MANENVMVMIDLLTNGFQCVLNVQVLFPGALHTWVWKPTYFKVRIVQKLKFVVGINARMVSLKCSLYRCKRKPCSLTILRIKENLCPLFDDHFSKGGEGQIAKLLFQFFSQPLVQPYMHTGIKLYLICFNNLIFSTVVHAHRDWYKTII